MTAVAFSDILGFGLGFGGCGLVNITANGNRNQPFLSWNGNYQKQNAFIQQKQVQLSLTIRVTRSYN